VLVALLIERHPAVDLSRVTRALDRAVIAVDARLSAAGEAIPGGADLRPRLVTSLKRITMSIARGHDRGVATAADVRDAMVFIDQKLVALESIETVRRVSQEKVAAARMRERAPRETDLRAEACRALLANGPKTLAAILTALRRSTGQRLHDVQIRRALTAIGAVQVGHGIYAQAPTPANRIKR
jgi:hypothetical protein